DLRERLRGLDLVILEAQQVVVLAGPGERGAAGRRGAEGHKARGRDGRGRRRRALDPGNRLAPVTPVRLRQLALRRGAVAGAERVIRHAVVVVGAEVERLERAALLVVEADQRVGIRLREVRDCDVELVQRVLVALRAVFGAGVGLLDQCPGDRALLDAPPSTSEGREDVVGHVTTTESHGSVARAPTAQWQAPRRNAATGRKSRRTGCLVCSRSICPW